jgi:hypothetical protein
MPRHILSAYVDGSDIGDIADMLDDRFEEFVENRRWTAGSRARYPNSEPSLKVCELRPNRPNVRSRVQTLPP